MPRQNGKAARVAVLAVVAVALAALGVRWLVFPGSSPGDTAAPAAATPPAAAAERLSVPPDASRVSDAESPAERPENPGAGKTEPPEPQGVPQLLRVHGRVLAIDGSPLPGVGIGPETSTTQALAFSDGTGAFAGEWTVSSPRGSFMLTVQSAGHVTLLAPTVDASRAQEPCLVVAAPAVTLAGNVVDEAEAPVPEAVLQVEVSRDLFREFPEPLDRLRTLVHRTTSDAQGTFEGVVPRLDGAPLTTSHEGYESDRREVPEGSRRDLRIVLYSQAVKGNSIRGIVLLPDRTPAAGAKVLFDDRSTTTAEDGRFRLLHSAGARFEGPLVATLAGHQAAVLEDVLTSHPEDEPVTLVLGDAPLAIAGHVVDADASPLPGWRISLLDGIEISRNQVPPLLAELGGDAAAFWNPVLTAEDGSFRLEGLQARDYRVRAYDPVTLLMLESDPVPAGTAGLELRAPADALLERVAGRVISRDGRPVPDVTVNATVVTYSTGGAVSFDNGAAVVTDLNGRFEILRVPREHVYLSLGGDSIIPENHAFVPGENVEQLEIPVALRCHFRLTVTGQTEEAMMFQIFDAQGHAQSVYTFEGGGWSATSRARIQAGGTPIRAVSEDGVELALYRDWESELVRVPLHLVPGEVSEVTVAVPAE